MPLRTAYLDVTQADLSSQVEHALRDRCMVLVYGPTSSSARIARAVLVCERRIGRSVRITREHDRWVLTR